MENNLNHHQRQYAELEIRRESTTGKVKPCIVTTVTIEGAAPHIHRGTVLYRMENSNSSAEHVSIVNTVRAELYKSSLISEYTGLETCATIGLQYLGILWVAFRVYVAVCTR